jgi:hypothetical protein
LLLIWEGQPPHGCQAHWGKTQKHSIIRAAWLTGNRKLAALFAFGIGFLEDPSMSGKLATAFNSYLRNMRRFRTGDTLTRNNAREALRHDLDALIAGLEDEPNWDAADKKAAQWLFEHEDEQL